MWSLTLSTALELVEYFSTVAELLGINPYFKGASSNLIDFYLQGSFSS